ncbi:MAG: hypothetical protein Q8K75_08705 [Chlamydiales bacterium]|nr:hypothetical protein [Chlamydiales bacterium]
MDLNFPNNNLTTKHSITPSVNPPVQISLAKNPELAFRVDKSAPTIHSRSQAESQTHYKIKPSNIKFTQHYSQIPVNAATAASARVPRQPQQKVAPLALAPRVASPSPHPTYFVPTGVVQTPNIQALIPRMLNLNQYPIVPTLGQASHRIYNQPTIQHSGEFSMEDLTALACICKLNPHMTRHQGVDKLVDLAMRKINFQIRINLATAWSTELESARRLPGFDEYIQSKGVNEDEMCLIFPGTFAKLEKLGTFFFSEQEWSWLIK